MVQTARTASFFIPSTLGTQDGALVAMAALFTGTAVAGLGVAILRRLRQLIWIGAGYLIAGYYSWGRRPRSRGDEDE